MDKSLKTRTVALAVVVPLILAVGSLVAVNREADPPLQKLTVGASSPSAERSAAGVDSAMATDLPAMAMPYRQNYVLAAPLPALPDKAAAYRFTPGDGRSAAVNLARVLKVAGEPIREEGQWIVGTGDLTVVVSDSPGLPWFLSEGYVSAKSDASAADDPIAGSSEVTVGEASGGLAPDGTTSVAPSFPPAPPSTVCVVPASPHTPADSGQEPGCSYSDSPDCLPPDFAYDSPEAKSRIEILCGGGTSYEPPEPVRPVGLPDRAEAEGIARSVFAELGWSTDGLTVEDFFSAWFATSPMRIDGVEVSPYQSLSVGPNGRIVNGNGYAAGVEKLGDYPLVGVEEGFRRLTDGRLLAGQVPLPATSRAAEPGVAPSPSAYPLPADLATTVPPPTPPGASVDSQPAQLPIRSDDCRYEGTPTAKEGSTCVVTSIVGSGITVPEPGKDFACPADVSCRPSYPPDDLVPPTIEVTGARLVLTLMNDLFVPAYVFEVGQEFGGQSPPVTAVVDDLIENLGAP